jgi:hypothetical protein
VPYQASRERLLQRLKTVLFARRLDETIPFIGMFLQPAIALIEVFRATHAIHRIRVPRDAQRPACPREYLRDQIELAIHRRGVDTNEQFAIPPPMRAARA